MAAKTQSRRNTGRQRISPRGDTRFVRRDSQRRFNESDDTRASLRGDRRKRAKKTVRAG